MLTCPACGREIDPLRAGQVAIVEGKFLYFCDAAHKSDFFAGRASSPAGEEVETRTPPPVQDSVFPPPPPPPEITEKEEPAQVAPRNVGQTIAFGKKAASPPEGASPEESETSASPPEDSASPEGSPREEITLGEGPIVDEPVPVSVPERRPAPRASALDEGPASEAREPSTLLVFGACVGVLASAVRLVPALEPAQLPFAFFAFAVLLFAAWRAGDLALRAPSMLGATAALGAALVARATHDARAASLTSFSGVSIAGVLAIEVIAHRARGAIAEVRQRLAERLAVRARVARAEAIVTVPASEVRAGEQVLVDEGEIVPVDGVIASGEAVVLPWPESPSDLAKREGDAVVAGAEIVRGAVRVTTTRTGNDRTLLRLVLSQQMETRAPLVVVARWTAIAGAPAGALLAGFAGFAAGQTWLEIVAAAAAAAMALGAVGPTIAVSVRHTRGLLTALKHGVAYRDPAAFDRAAQADVAVLCARGTLLLGEPEVVAVEALGALGDPSRALELAAGVANGSSHPFALAILRTARARGVRPDNVRNAVHAGSGATALDASGERLVLGRRAFLLSERVSVAVADARTTELEAQGRSVLLVALAGKVVGLLALQDGLRAGARAAIQRLHDARIEPVLLSGEARETCETIGRALDIDHVRPEVAFAERASEVRALGGGGHVVAVFGHPARDDGALGAADVSVAMGAAGAAVGEWSIVLASEDVRDAALALTIPQTTRERARIAAVIGVVPAALGALLVILVGLPWMGAPLAAFVGGAAALLYAKE